ncbi:MAG: 2Fe-2S iron-sulfur cluster-binding protein [Bacillota bacterium]
MSTKINITVDGRKVETEDRRMLLPIINELGIQIPQLCNHPSLTPSGACRLCVVEITKKNWNGESKIVTSCLYPAEEGLIVSTRSEEVLKTRRHLLELYLAQCPGSEEIKALALLEGIDATPFTTPAEADNKCIMCGLCTRVCQDCGPGAISTLGRGFDKEIGPNPDFTAENCTGCRTCTYICPTDAIEFSQENGIYKIWNREFEVPTCSVDPELCRSCGRCEEVCPYSIPRVTFYKTGLSTAQISQETCVGCGICLGVCPTGAIKQKKTEPLTDYESFIFKSDLKGKDLVFACPRSPMPAQNNIIRVSCIGSLDISVLLYCIAAGANSVALICRDKDSCPYHEGGNLGEKRLATARELLSYCGLETEQLTLLKPAFGLEGPVEAWQNYISAMKNYSNKLKNIYQAGENPLVDMDLALDIVSWLKKQPELDISLPLLVTSWFDTSTDPSAPVLYLDRLPELHMLMALLMDEPEVLNILSDAATVLNNRNLAVRCVASEKNLSDVQSEKIITFIPGMPDNLPSGSSLVTLNELAGFSAGETNEPFTFKIAPKKRKELLEKHADSINHAFLCDSAEQYLQYALLLRPGAWIQSQAEKPHPLFSTGDTDHEKSVGIIEQQRINNHPILPPIDTTEIKFTFNDREYTAREGEVITTALYAAGITVFGHHQRDGGAQGVYCVNGQCSQCMVIADGKPVKGCMTAVTPGMKVNSAEGLPELPDTDLPETINPQPEVVKTDVLIIGGGPAGISAAIELGKAGVNILVIDDKQELGGKLSLQTHNFFGSVADCYAGLRGVEIGHILAGDLSHLPNINTWINSTVVGVFSDGKFGVSGNGTYKLVEPKRVLFSTGAREKSLAFPGADLPGVYGAGAFQTLVNRDLVKCAERLFIIGGGNVGLIGAYHALQAGIDVVGLVEALPRCGGYKVHEDKIKRLGVPVYTSHTVLKIEGEENVERIIITEIDENFEPVKGTERSFEVDTVLMAVGLSPVNELLAKAREYGIEAYAAGDAEEIAEASAAIFSGKIIGRRMAQGMGIDLPVPSDWESFSDTLKHHTVESIPFQPEDFSASVYPLIRCMQEIPCNPCTEACPNNCITMPESILSLPEYSKDCIGCGQCVLACPGLAITLVINDYDPEGEKALLVMPYEFVNDIIPLGKEVTTTDMEGNVVGKGKVIAYKDRISQNSRRLLLLEVPQEDKLQVAGFMIREIEPGKSLETPADEEDPIICRCERVRKSEIVGAIRSGTRDMNQLKAAVRAGLGGCNGKTCNDLILRIYREEGIPMSEITLPTHRPLVAEVHLGDFIAGNGSGHAKVEQKEEADDVG